MTITKKDIDVIKIQITWDYVTNEVDIYSRKYLQYFVIWLTFIIAILLGSMTGNYDLAIAIMFIILLLLPTIWCIFKMKEVSTKLANSFGELLDELDKLK